VPTYIIIIIIISMGACAPSKSGPFRDDDWDQETGWSLRAVEKHFHDEDQRGELACYVDRVNCGRNSTINNSTSPTQPSKYMQSDSNQQYAGFTAMQSTSGLNSAERPPHPVCWGFDGRLVVALPNTTVAVVGTAAPPPIRIYQVCSERPFTCLQSLSPA